MINAKYAADERKVPITNAIRAALVIYLIVSVNPVFSQAREPDAKVDLSSDRPNIIFLFADDQRPDTISAYGNPHIRTPHLDQLARRGTNFRRNYCAGSFSGAVCVASRAMLMTGQPWMKLPSGRPASEWGDAIPLPARLSAEGGYQTFIIGKWHNGPAMLKRSFQNGRSVYMGGMANHADFTVQDLNAGKLSAKRKAESFSSELFADEAVRFIETAESDQPFFLYVAFMAPHDPRNPPQPYREMYYQSPPPLPENFVPLHPFNNGPQASAGRDESLAPWPREASVIRDQLCEYYGLVTHLDEQLGKIMRAIKKHSHHENTVVIYTADHGLAMGSHGLLGKQNIYEESMQSPLIIAGPGIPQGQSTQALNYIHDMYATVCETAQVTPPAEVESRSLWPVIRGESTEIHPSLFLPFQEHQRAVVTPDWKLHVYPKINHQLLFDLKNDPLEMSNLASDSLHEDQVENLLAQMQHWRQKWGDTLPLETEAPEPFKPVYDNGKRTIDRWQPKWILDKYFDGKETTQRRNTP